MEISWPQIFGFGFGFGFGFDFGFVFLICCVRKRKLDVRLWKVEI